MYFFVFDVVATPIGGEVSEGYAVVWVSGTDLSAAEQVARTFAGGHGLVVRTLVTAHERSEQQLEKMSLDYLAPRIIAEGACGYFVAKNDPTSDAPLSVRPLNAPPQSE
jgi:hypothetical protein